LNYKLREMQDVDIPHIVEGEQNIFGTTLGYELLYTELHLNPYAHYFVLEIDQKVCGYIGLWINENTEIINFYIDKEYQGNGFGKMMLDFVIRLSKLCKANSISLEVRESNNRAILLYEKYGFMKMHIRKKYYHDGEDAIVMVKKLEVTNDRIRSRNKL